MLACLRRRRPAGARRARPARALRRDRAAARRPALRDGARARAPSSWRHEPGIAPPGRSRPGCDGRSPRRPARRRGRRERHPLRRPAPRLGAGAARPDRPHRYGARGPPGSARARHGLLRREVRPGGRALPPRQPDELFSAHGYAGRGLERLASLLLLPIVSLVPDTADQLVVGHWLWALCWALLALPVYAFARGLELRRRWALVAAAGTVFVPWAVFGMIFINTAPATTTAVAALWAMWRATVWPSPARTPWRSRSCPRRLARVSHVALAIAWPVAILVQSWRELPGGDPRGARVRALPRLFLRDHRLLVVLAGIAALAIAVQGSTSSSAATRRASTSPWTTSGAGCTDGRPRGDGHGLPRVHRRARMVGPRPRGSSRPADRDVLGAGRRRVLRAALRQPRGRLRRALRDARGRAPLHRVRRGRRPARFTSRPRCSPPRDPLLRRALRRDRPHRVVRLHQRAREAVVLDRVDRDADGRYGRGPRSPGAGRRRGSHRAGRTARPRRRRPAGPHRRGPGCFPGPLVRVQRGAVPRAQAARGLPV